MIVLTTHDLKYLPLPNTVEIVLSDQECDPALTHTAFVVPVFDDLSVMLCQNATRGIEIAGGHVEPGETLQQAAAREAMEETGCIVYDLVPIGFLRMMSRGKKPVGSRYPHPLSFQQFYGARVREVLPFTPNQECDMPLRTSQLEGFARPSIKIFAEAALAALKGK